MDNEFGAAHSRRSLTPWVSLDALRWTLSLRKAIPARSLWHPISNVKLFPFVWIKSVISFDTSADIQSFLEHRTPVPDSGRMF
jgi:hypothetical protein